MSTPELPAPEFALLRLAELAERVDALDAAVAMLTEQLAELADDYEPGGKGYSPIPAPRWWRLAGEEREAAITRLRAWVDQVYRPCYGKLAASLPPCWPEHPLALFALDWLSELHSILYLQPRRTAGMLAGQAEWQTRLLPAAADQITRETAGCAHGRAARRP